KFQRRQAIAALQMQTCQEKGDKEGEDCWAFIMHTVTTLQADRMSDEEDREVDRKSAKLVLDLEFRHHEFRSLFRMVDSVREKMDKGQGGRKLKRRVEISRKADRPFPKDIPSVFLSPTFCIRTSDEAQNSALQEDFIR
ncbi:hypothetical protein GYMLUDRAFT_179728, partial [Collybiopsis luxurians FD-317 M1]